MRFAHRLCLTSFVTLLSLYGLPIIAHAAMDPGLPSDLTSVVKLETADSSALCTGIVVGNHPLTVLTAGHCLLGNAIKFEGKYPVFYKTFSDMAVAQPLDSARDVGILVYGHRADTVKDSEIFNVLPVSLDLKSEVEVCGFGKPTSGRRMCGKNKIAATQGRIAEYVNEMGQDGIRFMNLFRSIVESAPSLFYFTKIIDFRLSETGPNGPALGGGDSGGPWFVKNENGKRTVVAVSIFMKEKGMFSAGYPVQSEAVQELLQSALDQGGVVEGFRR